jgi:hypothetical protein
MSKLKLILLMMTICISANAYAQSQQEKLRVYAELLGTGTNLLGLNKNVKVTVDMGQPQSSFKGYTLQDDNNKDIKFNSMVAAMNYMGQRGWVFVQTYTISHGKDLVYHWLMYKDVNDSSEIMEGLNVKNID